jgi:hypothetical protein
MKIFRSSQPSEDAHDCLRNRCTRILHAPAAVAGNSAQISRTLRTQGHDSVCLTYERNQFTSTGDIVVWTGEENVLQREIKRLTTVFKQSWLFNIYCFNYGSTLAFPTAIYQEKTTMQRFSAFLHFSWTSCLQWVELLILWARRARIVVIFQGDDARQGDVQIARYEESIARHDDFGYYSPISDRRKRRLIRRLRRFGAKLMALNPDLVPLLGDGAEFVPYCHIDLDEWPLSPLPRRDGPLIIGHFPTSMAIKGTPVVEQVVSSLRRDGYSVELRLLSGVLRSDVKSVLAECHVLVDQLYAGFYGGVAVESMSLGRPALAYIRSEDLAYVPLAFTKNLPLLSVSESDLREKLLTVLSMSHEQLEEWGFRCRSFVEEWHQPDSVSRYVLQQATRLRLMKRAEVSPRG